jgi:hypothetical protein
MRLSLATTLALFGTIVMVQACGRSTPTSPSATPEPARSVSANPVGMAGAAGHLAHAGQQATPSPNADVNAQIAELRRLLAPFHNFEKAVEYGYSVPVPGPGVCLSDPARGGMGYHYTLAGKNLVDGVVNLLEPEFIVYSPTRNGGVRLSAVDYFVPYAFVPRDAEPPSLLGVPFAQEDNLNAWVMHIWAFWPNPAGMFENYNPDVPLCPE